MVGRSAAHASPGRDRGAIGRRIAAGSAIVLAAATAVGIGVLRPTGEDRPDASILGSLREVYPARVAAVEERPCEGDTEGALSCRLVAFRLQGGPDEGETVELDLIADTPRVTELDPGDAVLMGRQPDAPEGFQYAFLDPDRRATLVYLALLFAIVVVALGGIRGIAALAGLGATVVVLLAFILPAIVEGRSPIAVSLVGAAAIAFLALYVSHGFTTKTTVALLGTIGGLVSVALLAVVFMGLAALTGFGTEEAFIVQALGGSIDLRGLMLGGMIIGALGAIDDMTVTQASAVWELRATDPDIRPAALLRAGMRIGRDHVASTVNTLVLAYAGASMPLLVLFVLSEQTAGTVANGEVLAAEIVRTLVGSIGLVASVPITTWLAVAIPSRRSSVSERREILESADE
ncbi:MAG TPA: YibE/F family protein [Actinomycetota bacterium]|nr:YibE/F family protein [Actinomycetota bacterium]